MLGKFDSVVLMIITIGVELTHFSGTVPGIEENKNSP